MGVSVECTSCGRRFEVADDLSGRKVKCPCGHVVEVGGDSRVVDFLSEELNLQNDPLFSESPAEWAKATGAPPEIAQLLEKKMAKKLSSSAGFMMAVTGVVIAVLLIVGLIAFWLAAR